MAHQGRWSRDRVIGAVLDRCGLPDGATVVTGRSGGLSYVDNGLVRRLHVAVPNDRPGAASWSVSVGDATLERPDSAAFSTHYRVDDALIGGSARPIDSRNWTNYPWPTADTDIDSELIDDVRRFAPVMLWFLKDRRELGLLLIHGEDDDNGAVWRDGITAARWAGAPAGMVQAVILARYMGDDELEALALAKLDRQRDREVRGFGGAFAEAVGHWARQYASWAPVDLSDLAAIATKRGRDRGPRAGERP